MTSANWHQHLDSPPNISLPALQAARTLATVADLVAKVLGPPQPSLTYAGSSTSITSAKLLDYKPGKRGLIHYEVAGIGDKETTVVFGKVYAEPSQAVRVYKTMKLLWDEVFYGQAQLSLPYPVGCIPELSMLVYIPAQGYFLNEMLMGDQALSTMMLVSAWLGTLHQHRLTLPRQFHLATELVNVQAWAALVGRCYPDQAATAGQIAGYLQERGDVLPFVMDVPIHKDFHYGHVIGHCSNGKQKLQIIDFDEMRLGDPNFDLAHFCANLYLLACRQHNRSWPFTTLQAAFLDAYARFTGWNADERLVYFYAYTYLKIAWQLCNGYGPQPRPKGKERHDQVRQMLQQGLVATLASNEHGAYRGATS